MEVNIYSFPSISLVDKFRYWFIVILQFDKQVKASRIMQDEDDSFEYCYSVR
jgi:hypothetical protein